MLRKVIIQPLEYLLEKIGQNFRSPMHIIPHYLIFYHFILIKYAVMISIWSYQIAVPLARSWCICVNIIMHLHLYLPQLSWLKSQYNTQRILTTLKYGFNWTYVNVIFSLRLWKKMRSTTAHK